MLDDGCFFPFILMNLGKLKLFKKKKNLSNWLVTLLKKLLMADVAELAGFVLQLQMHYEENPLTVTFQASFRDIRVGSISFLEALSKVCERNTVMCTRTLLHAGFHPRALFCCFHVGRYCPPRSQALKALVCVIDEDPVLVLVVSLRVITCCHCWLKNIRFWKLIEV